MVDRSTQLLLLGGSGFVGSALLRQGLDSGYNFTALQHRKSIPEQTHPRLTVRSGSITSLSAEQLSVINPGGILHAARISGRRSIGRRIAARKSKRANERLLDWAQHPKNNAGLLYVAGSLGYGSHEAPVDESTPLKPTSYAREYHRGEAPLVAASRSGAKIQIVRPGWIYGPGSWFEQFFLRPIRNQGVIPLYGEGLNRMSLIHIDDCVRMILHVFEQGKTGGTYNIPVGATWTQNELVDVLHAVTGFPIRNISLADVRRRYGGGASEAFQFSLEISTRYPELWDGFDFLYPDHQEGLRSVLEQTLHGTENI